jgi:N-acyl-D-amino-acid deacylase
VDYDLKIVGGDIVDGSGAPRWRGDVGIKDGRIVALGEAKGAAVRTIEAKGRVVAPGFVDIHTHYDAQVLWDPMLTCSPWHGVTSVVVGNCGFGVAPTRPEHRDLILRTLERVEGMSLAALKAGIGADWPFETFPQYMDALERQPLGINVAVMVGHTPVRLAVMGDESTTRAATPAEIAQMKGIVAEAMEAGAVGFATSVSKVHIGYSGRPVPSRLAEFGEMLEIADAVGKSGHGIIHYNVGRDPRWEEYEALHAKSGRPVIWTALLTGSLGPGSHRPQLEKSAVQIASGLPIYPQGACRPIQIEFDFRSPVVFDTWASFERSRAAPDEAARRAVYADPDFRARVKRQVAGRGPDDAWFMGKEAEGDTRRAMFRALVVSWAEDESLIERKLVDLAAERGVDPVDLMFDLALESRLRLRLRAMVLNFEEDEVREVVQDPNVLIALGDGGAHLSQLCDACYATHLLGHWVREDGAISLERAVHQLTQRPADIFGLSDRGRLAIGLPADVVVFDPATVAAGPLERVHDLPAGEDRLISRPKGIDAVIVNGVLLPPPGQRPERPSGRLLRQRRT